MPKRIIGITLTAVVLLGAIVAFIAITKNKSENVFYETEHPQYRTISKETVANGKLEPRREIEIKPQVSGIIEELYVEAGDELKKGDLIAKIKIIPNMVSLNDAQSRVKRARNNVENVEAMYKRKKELLAKEIIPASEYEEIEINYLNAVEELRSAENNLQLIKEGQIKDGSAPTNTIVRSTIDGMVLDVPVEIGKSVIESNTFNDGTSIAVIADMGQIIFKGKVDETEVGRLNEGMPMVVSVGAIKDEEFDAVLEHVAPKGVNESGAVKFEIKAELKLKDGMFIRSGYSANAKVTLDERPDVLSISESLLSFEKEQPYIEIEKAPNEFERMNLELGLSDGIYVEVLNKASLDTQTVIKKPL